MSLASSGMRRCCCGKACCSQVLVLIFSQPKHTADGDGYNIYVNNLAHIGGPQHFIVDDLPGTCATRVYVFGGTRGVCSSLVASLQATYGAGCVSTTNPIYDCNFGPVPGDPTAGDVSSTFMNADFPLGCGSTTAYTDIDASRFDRTIIELVPSDGGPIGGTSFDMTGVSWIGFNTCSGVCTQVGNGAIPSVTLADGGQGAFCMATTCCACHRVCPDNAPPAKVRVTFYNISNMGSFSVPDGAGNPTTNTFDGYHFVRTLDDPGFCGDYYSYSWKPGDNDGIGFFYFDGPNAPYTVPYITMGILSNNGGVSWSGVHQNCCGPDLGGNFWYFGKYRGVTGSPTRVVDISSSGIGVEFFWEPFLAAGACGTASAGDPAIWKAALVASSCDPFYLEFHFERDMAVTGFTPVTFRFKMAVTEEP